MATCGFDFDEYIINMLLDSGFTVIFEEPKPPSLFERVIVWIVG